MTSNELMYGLHWAVVALMLAIAWLRGRNLLHPLFIMAAIFSVMLSDFLVRGYDISGYDDAELMEIPIGSVYFYQLSILATFLLTIVLAALIRSERIEAAVAVAWKNAVLPARALRAVELVGICIFAAEIVKRLNSVGWDPAEVGQQMLNARGDRAWDQAHFSGNFVYAIISIIQPFAAFAFAYLIVNATGGRRWRALAAYAAVLAVLITDASRTQVVIALAAVVGFLVLRPGNVALKVMSIGFVAALGLSALSLIYLYRSAGFREGALPGTEFAITYHQDDSYYRAVFAHHVADRGDPPWDAGYFTYANLTNPIPRALWPDKPILEDTFWGDYKLYFVTILYVGEIVAMAGTAATPVLALMFGLFAYSILYRAAVLLAYPLGVAAYVLVALYTYMLIRSSQNLTHFMYLPAFGVLVVVWLRQLLNEEKEDG